jgi:hypothetical protein
MVDEGRRCGFELCPENTVVPGKHPFVAVGVQHRWQKNDRILPYPLHLVILTGNQVVRQHHSGLSVRDFGCMQAMIDPHHCLPFPGQCPRFLVRNPACKGQPTGDPPIMLLVTEILGTRDGRHDNGASFHTSANLGYLDTRGRSIERFEILYNLA